uniref:Uncharacterized protein n=1 Tax=Streptomyces sp. NBC_00008 TaxID=2903610 RepID=A0AAU2W0K3_9ACTN
MFAHLTPSQLSGVACILCADENGEMIPVSHLDGVQIFAHVDCGAQPAPVSDAPAPARTALVVGPTSTDSERRRLRKFAIEVAAQVGAITTFALHTDYSVGAFEAVYVLGRATELRNADCLVLVAEALAARMDVFDVPKPGSCGTCDCGRSVTVHPRWDREGALVCTECAGWAPECAHCGEDDGDFVALEIVEDGHSFHPVHPSCLTEARRSQPGAVFAIA